MRGMNGPGALFSCRGNDFSIRVRYFNRILIFNKVRYNNMMSGRFTQIVSN